MKKIDAHAHVGSFGGWADVRITADELIEQMDGYEIEKTILCASGPDKNEEVCRAKEAYPDRFLPICYLNPLSGTWVQEGERYLKEKNFRGIKLHPLSNAYVADSEVCDGVMALAGAYDVPVFIHSGHPPFSLPWSIALLAERHPSVKTVMVHMGHGHGVYIDAAIKMAKRYDNIYLEMSGMPMGSKIKEAYETVGRERIMFGTDAPFHHPTVEIHKVLTCGLDEQALEDIFYNNASKLMNL